jgi:hypothetical protein
MKLPWRRKKEPDCQPSDRKSLGVAARNLRAMRPSARRTDCGPGGFRTGQ